MDIYLFMYRYGKNMFLLFLQLAQSNAVSSVTGMMESVFMQM